MTRRRPVLVGLVPAAFAAVAAVGFVLVPRSAVTQENVDRIRPGMGLREVEAILGGPGEQAPHGGCASSCLTPRRRISWAAAVSI